MMYYKLEHSSSEDIGQTFPQSQHMKSDLHIDDPNHLWNAQGKLSDDVDIPDSILHPKAVVTDLISSVPIPYPIISDKLKKIIEKYPRHGIQFFRTNLIVKGRKIPYWLMNGFDFDYKYIDFDKSIVFKVGIGRKEISRLDIRSAGGFEMAKESFEYPESILITKLELMENIPYDIILLDRADGSKYYFSENLKKEIEEEGCTGIRFVKYSEKKYP